MRRTELARKTPLARGTGLKQTVRPPVPPPDGRSAAKTGNPPPKRSGGLQARRKRRRVEPGEVEWKQPRTGRCAVCRVRGPVVFHHILTEAKIRWHASVKQIAAGIVWDQRNALVVGAPVPWGGRCNCHAAHHIPPARGDTRIPLALVPDVALAFAVDLLGEGPAAEYFKRQYKPN